MTFIYEADSDPLKISPQKVLRTDIQDRCHKNITTPGIPREKLIKYISFNVRQPGRECVYLGLVRRSHFRSRDKDDVHTVTTRHRRSQDFLWDCTFLPRKSWPFFSRRTQNNSLKLRNYPLPPSRSPQFPQKLDSCSAWGCTQLSPVNLPPPFFIRPEGARAPSAPHGYVYAIRSTRPRAKNPCCTQLHSSIFTALH